MTFFFLFLLASDFVNFVIEIQKKLGTKTILIMSWRNVNICSGPKTLFLHTILRNPIKLLSQDYS